MPFPAHCHAPGIVAPGEPAGAWAYPLDTGFTDHGQIVTGSGWDAVAWNTNGQCVVAVGASAYLYYAGGDVWDVEHAEHSKLGVLTSTDGVNWADYGGNPIAEFQPLGNGGINPNEEGYWYFGVWRRPNGAWTCIFGGQEGVGSTTVKTNVYMQTSTDGLAWTPNSATGRIKIIDENDTAFAGYGTSNDEMSGTGAWYDEANSLWHVIYTTKNKPGEIYSVYHAQGADLQTLSGADSNLLLHINDNPYVAGATMRGGAIVDRGNGMIDVLVMATDGDGLGSSKSAIVRVPILPDYSWTAPGPAEVLYYMNEDFGITGAVRTTAAFFPAVNKALIPYIQYSDQDVRMKSAAASQTSDGLLPYSPASARFTGSSDQFLSKAGLTGQVDGKLFTFSFAIKMAAAPPYAADQTIFRLAAGSTFLFQIVVKTDGIIRFFARNSAGTQILGVSTTSVVDNTGFYRVVASFDMASYANSNIYINETSVKPASADIFTNDLIDFGGVNTSLFGHQSTANQTLDAEIADFGFSPVWFNLNDSRVLRRFFTAVGELQNPGGDGRRMYLKTPQVFFSGNGAAFPTNQGSGGAFTVNNGPLTNGAAPPGHPS